MVSSTQSPPEPTLRGRATEVSRRALASGAIRPLPTRIHLVDEGGVRFQVRVLDRGRRLPPPAPADDPANPFLPCDERLVVAETSSTHRCVLNKYPVLDDHLLLVTRHYEPQAAPLTTADFEAAWTCLGELDGLAFFNGGVAAGSSQHHKHLQVVPLPLAPAHPGLPVAPLLSRAGRGPTLVTGLGFRHAFVRLEGVSAGDPGGSLLAAWRRASEAVDLGVDSPFNLLFTRTWLLAVPRAHECFEGMSVNALGFVGALLARDHSMLARIREVGPMAILAHTGQPLP